MIINKIIYWLFAAWFTFVAFMTFGRQQITFGYGLGDVFYLFLILLFFVVASILRYIMSRKRGRYVIAQIVLSLAIVAFIVYMTLAMTLNRGIEYPWQGNWFYE